MRTTIAARIQALRDMTVHELRTEYARVFGEETRSAHREQLWRAIAWRIQADAEGDLPERVRRQAAELARDADFRTRAPRDPLRGAAPPPEARTARRPFAAPHDARLPLPGTVLTREYRGREVRVTVLDRGFEHEGKVHRSLSAVAKAVTGAHWNGFHFFGIAGRNQ
ncbi:MAG: DUF2924 domain-containing protein [Planctomycetes bacterium]|nr:DUF2924 domain-containing protein [Planctomycetota bacterium]